MKDLSLLRRVRGTPIGGNVAPSARGRLGEAVGAALAKTTNITYNYRIQLMLRNVRMLHLRFRESVSGFLNQTRKVYRGKSYVNENHSIAESGAPRPAATLLRQRSPVFLRRQRRRNPVV